MPQAVPSIWPRCFASTSARRCAGFMSVHRASAVMGGALPRSSPPRRSAASAAGDVMDARAVSCVGPTTPKPAVIVDGSSRWSASAAWWSAATLSTVDASSSLAFAGRTAMRWPAMSVPSMAAAASAASASRNSTNANAPDPSTRASLTGPIQPKISASTSAATQPPSLPT